jgi:hypothetical protein
MGMAERVRRQPPERLAERVSAAIYGTVLVLAALPLIDPDDVDSGAGWGLVSGVGAATWVAHLFAEVVGDGFRHGAAHGRAEIRRATTDGLPILLAAVAPALVLFLGRVDVLGARGALWTALAVALVQLAGVSAFVGWAASPGGARPWPYAALTVAIGVVVIVLKLRLSH